MFYKKFRAFSVKVKGFKLEYIRMNMHAYIHGLNLVGRIKNIY